MQVQVLLAAPDIFFIGKIFGRISNKKFKKSGLDKRCLINNKHRLFGFMVARVGIDKKKLIDMDCSKYASSRIYFNNNIK